MAKLMRSTFIALAAAIAATLVFSATAGAQTDGPYVGNTVTSAPPTTVAPGEVENASTEVKSATDVKAAAEVKSESLAFTGSDATTLALIGVVAVIAGGSILIVRRRSVS
ncbi:MAG: LPXTG cell wall anchor domain-containing protein [Microthrixaceae bacterium]|nr:LPXTG cell wall anchor domain-containing protein [Microthrixaceae bacterium]